MSAATIPRKTYFIVWAILMVLLAATWAVARLDLGVFNAVAAMTIAVVKMLLVILFFMHVRQSSRPTRLFVGAGFLWLLIMLVLTMSDYRTRGEARGWRWQQPIPNEMPGRGNDQ